MLNLPARFHPIIFNKKIRPTIQFSNHLKNVTIEMVWPRGREYHQEDVKHASIWNEKKGKPKKRWLDNILDDMKE